MKVLWFSHIRLNIGDQLTGYAGGNWISSLRDLIESKDSIELGIAFFGDEDQIVHSQSGTTYFQLKQTCKNKFDQLLYRWSHKVDSFTQKEKVNNVIEKFKPDIIQIFGTEGLFGLVGNDYNIPTIIHIQGLLNPCLNTWMFPGTSQISILCNSNLRYFIRGAGLFHDYFRFKKKAKRELSILKSNKNFIGRTHWDQSLINFYSPNSQYYHCDEILREGFYHTEWKSPSNKKFTITSTINADIYKGLDVILKTAKLLKTYTDILFEWKIFGINAQSEYVKLVESVVGESIVDNNITLMGIVGEVELIEGLLKSNVFVHCSYIDNSPNSVCEAQIIGLPVISTDVGGISSLIQNDITGVLVPANDPYSLVSKIQYFNENVEFQLRISTASRIVARKRHSQERISTDLIEIYNNIFKNKV